MAPVPTLAIHGGLGRMEGNFQRVDPDTGELRDRNEEFHAALVRALGAAWRVLDRDGARAGVLAAVRLLEDDPLFNAGLGSKLQADGQIRMSAGLMDGPGACFSGAVNVQGVRHPVDFAALLASREHTVLAGAMATELAHNEGLELRDPFTPARIAEHERKLKGEHGTVGAVALDSEGRLFAATSTGGFGGEHPGRVSDTPTVAGTYASARAAVSCTGRGEHIVHHAAAARVVVRVDDGMTLAEAVSRTVAEADARAFAFGLIALDVEGEIRVGQSEGTRVLHAFMDATGSRTFHATV